MRTEFGLVGRRCGLQGGQRQRNILMQKHLWQIFLTTACWSLLVLAPLSARAQSTPASTQPTAADSPQQIDQIWQQASSKYDAARKALLADVRRTASAGPFHPDWESLRHYDAPDWYKD